MRLLEEKIRKEGIIKPKNVLKVDSFFNHQMDISLFCEMGKEFKRIFSDCKVDKILTIEVSGIGLACITAQYFQVPVVCAKKTETINIDGDVYSTQVQSYSHNRMYEVFLSKKCLQAKENVLIIDDLLANGCSLLGLTQLVYASGANLIGAGIGIEKGFQVGGEMMREAGVRVESLAIIDSMSEEKGFVFRKTGNEV